MKSLDSSDADATVKKLNIFAKFTKMLNLSEKRIHLNISSADSDRFIWGVWVCGGGGTCGGVCGGGVRWVVGWWMVGGPARERSSRYLAMISVLNGIYKACNMKHLLMAMIT